MDPWIDVMSLRAEADLRAPLAVGRRYVSLQSHDLEAGRLAVDGFHHLDDEANLPG